MALGGVWEGFGEDLGGSWEDFSQFCDGFWRDFWAWILKRSGEESGES